MIVMTKKTGLDRLCLNDWLFPVHVSVQMKPVKTRKKIKTAVQVGLSSSVRSFFELGGKLGLSLGKLM